MVTRAHIKVISNPCYEACCPYCGTLVELDHVPPPADGDEYVCPSCNAVFEVEWERDDD